MKATQTPKIALFATCPVDLFRPQAGFASASLLQQAGCRVSVPPQSCCGQIAYNNGLPGEARQLAWQVIRTFMDYDYVVLPSGSCGGMVKRHYPDLFAGDERQPAVRDFCDKVFELTTFLRDVLDWSPPEPNCDLSASRITYHDSCAGLRELGIRTQPRSLLASCANARVDEMLDTEVCCGFGGSFCMKFPDIADRMAEEKLANAQALDPHYLVGGDVSCLLHLAGKWQRQQDEGACSTPVEIRHVAELLAGWLDSSPINARRQS
jgi:L-lactate dehydrogenase complex protein LldE